MKAMPFRCFKLERPGRADLTQVLDAVMYETVILLLGTAVAITGISYLVSFLKQRRAHSDRELGRLKRVLDMKNYRVDQDQIYAKFEDSNILDCIFAAQLRMKFPDYIDCMTDKYISECRLLCDAYGANITGLTRSLMKASEGINDYLEFDRCLHNDKPTFSGDEYDGNMQHPEVKIIHSMMGDLHDRFIKTIIWHAPKQFREHLTSLPEKAVLTSFIEAHTESDRIHNPNSWLAYARIKAEQLI